MREGWQISALGEVCDVIGGGTPSKRNSAFYEGDIPWATVRDMRNEVLSKTEFHISQEALNNSSTKVIPGHNVVIATRVGLGKVCLLEEDTAINQDLRGIIPKSKNIDVRFLFRWFQSIASKIEEEGTGATVKGVKLPFIKSLQLPIPPLPEQKRIVAILDEAFAGIDTAIANTEKNLANARELFESYLNSVFSQQGEGWTHSGVRELVADGILEKPVDGNHGEIHPKKSDFLDRGVPFLMAKDLVFGSVDQQSCHFISEQQAATLRKGFAKDGDVLLSHKGTIGRCAVLDTERSFVVLTPQLTYYRVKKEEKLNNRFLYYYFQSPEFLVSLNHIAGAGSTRAYIGITRQLDLSISFPNVEYQQRLASKLDELVVESRQIEGIYKQKLIALAELKESLCSTRQKQDSR